MILRNLTMEESFPHAYQQDLIKKQSEHFVNKSIAYGSIEKGYENLPTKLNSDNNLPLLINSNPPKLLIGTYVKNHWRVILASIVVGGVIWYVIDNQIKKSNRKKRLQN